MPIIGRNRKGGIKIAKTEKTKQIEMMLWNHCNEQGTFGCFEVTIGWFGKEIVDFLSYNTKGEFRCYEIKTSLKDYHSKAHKTFLGDYNYFVLTRELLDQLKEEEYKKYVSQFNSREPKKCMFETQMKNWGIGVLVPNKFNVLEVVVKPKRKYINLGDKSLLIESLTRSLNREVKKFYRIKGYWE